MDFGKRNRRAAELCSISSHALDRMLELKDMNVISFYRTDPIIVSLTGELHENLDVQANQAIAEWRRRFYPLQSDAGKGSADANKSVTGQ